ncbi:hypothetical protein [Halobaculum gomorrense]|uniref:HIT zinc finger n=1 Tax=Halobaculum gomorrense TaxID=43928 RepID=A0A1M5TU34_9EURY|nr:hypothetical protein [Halobaculum gomorrense]SHH54297.1 hypothetical protein SAMN05443636_2843 [Halobaculum gomorrense]
MSVTGRCQICERAEATHSCPRCGTADCDDHWNDGHGVCDDCAASSP